MKALLLISTALFITTSADARGYHSSGGRVHYSGASHTSSHGGRYSGSHSGSSHRGGHYTNYRTGGHYGCHKC